MKNKLIRLLSNSKFTSWATCLTGSIFITICSLFKGLVFIKILAGYIVITYLFSAIVVNLTKNIKDEGHKFNVRLSLVFFPGIILMLPFIGIVYGLYKLHKFISDYDFSNIFKSSEQKNNLKSKEDDMAYRTNVNSFCGTCGKEQ